MGWYQHLKFWLSQQYSRGLQQVEAMAKQWQQEKQTLYQLSHHDCGTK